MLYVKINIVNPISPLKVKTMNCIFETRRIKVAEADAHYATKKISCTQDAVATVKCVLGEYFDALDCEEFHVLIMDTKNKVNGIFRITRGTLDASLVHPREVFKPAILNSASSIILVHNHPSGDATPSKEDIHVTNRLTESGKILGIDVLDHIVYGSKTNCISVREFV
jgi:DNA repair protein RadC